MFLSQILGKEPQNARAQRPEKRLGSFRKGRMNRKGEKGEEVRRKQGKP
jgi:hypothetical protein